MGARNVSDIMPIVPSLLVMLAVAGAFAFAMYLVVVRRRRRRIGVAGDDHAQITSWENEGGNLPSREPATP